MRNLFKFNQQAIGTSDLRPFRQRMTKIFVSLLRLFFLVSVSYIILFPLLFMISNAFKPRSELLDPSIVWVPKVFTLDNIRTAITVMDFPHALLKTLLVNIISAFIEVFSCAVVAYGFARFQFPAKRFLFALVILTIVVPPQMIIVPSYLNFRQMDVFGVLQLVSNLLGKELRPNLLDTPLTFYLPSLFGVGLRSGLFIYIYRQFFKGLPNELEEAAWIDGAGPLRTFLRIVLPSSGVAILTVTIFSLVWHWNDYHLSVMYFNDNFSLAVVLSQLESELHAAGLSTDVNVCVRMAGCLLFVLPVLVVYLFLQKYFIKSIDRVGIVG